MAVIIWLGLFLILVGADMLTKALVVNFLKPIGEKAIINNFFYLSYVENRGMAFGMFKGARWIFVVLTIAILVCIGLYFIKNRDKSISLLAKLSLIMIGAGAVGNLIDRVRTGYVVDFLRFVFFGHSFAVFNFADVLVTCGTGLLCLYIIIDGKEKK